jgi:aspartyl-tRNA(Asn)/glutamyl-tRNA(Gln) amidotransferase subunit B
MSAPPEWLAEYEPVIGLECHVQLNTASKAFTTAANEFGAPPNTLIDPYTLGLPGSLPVLCGRAVEFAVRLGLACGCRIAERSEFARKSYFYPDLPKGYQITQSDAPLCEGGALQFLLHGEKRQVRLIRIHLEEDAGKNLHFTEQGEQGAQGVSLIDFTSTRLPCRTGCLVSMNRRTGRRQSSASVNSSSSVRTDAGVPLCELVSEPDLRSAEEAAECLRAVRQLVRFLGISDGNMEEGSLRCDANVSLRRRGSTALGQRTELKNINSFKYVQKAIEHELGRQAAILRAGGQVAAETRGWDAQRGTSRSQRSKESAHDYRYFPEPDLPPLIISAQWLAELQRSLPPTPLQRYDRYRERLGLSAYDAAALTAERELCEYFDALLVALGLPADAPAGGRELTAAEQGLAKLGSNWLLSELLGALHGADRAIAQSPVSAAALAELVAAVGSGAVSGRQAKEVFARMYAQGEGAAAIIDALGLRQLTDAAAIEAVCQKVVAAPANQAQVARYAQNPKLLGFFVGQVLAETGGRAKPELVNDILRRLLPRKV